MLRRYAILVAAVALVAACGSASESGDGDTDPPTTELAFVIDLGDGGEPQSVELDCATADGAEAQVCADLVAAHPDVFEFSDPGQPCTQIYGGPETIEVTGTVEGQAVEVDYSRENGCEIDRYDRIAEILEPLDVELTAQNLN